MKRVTITTEDNGRRLILVDGTEIASVTSGLDQCVVDTYTYSARFPLELDLLGERPEVEPTVTVRKMDVSIRGSACEAARIVGLVNTADWVTM